MDEKYQIHSTCAVPIVRVKGQPRWKLSSGSILKTFETGDIIMWEIATINPESHVLRDTLEKN